MMVDDMLRSSTAQSMPVSDVDSLMSEVAEANGLEFESQLDELGNPKLKLDAKDRAEIKAKPKSEALVMGVGVGDLPSAPKSAPGGAARGPAKQGGPPAPGAPGAAGSAPGGGGGGGGATVGGGGPKLGGGASGGTSKPAFAGARDDEAALEARLRALMGE
jgi:hypothetical protein